MTRFNPDDPKWTAYVLGELSVTDREAVEVELESSEEARSLVEELRLAADLTKSELRDQAPLTSLTFEQRQTIRAAAGVQRPRWFGTRPMVWAACFAAVSFTLLAAVVSSIVLHQRHATAVPAIESTVAENQSPQPDSERETERPSLAETKESGSSAPLAVDRRLALSPPVAATAPAPAPAPPPPAAVPKQSVIAPEQSVVKEAIMPASTHNEPPGTAETASADQKAQAVIPLDKGPTVSRALVARGGALPPPASGRIFGNISDASAALIPGVAVNATNVQTGTVVSAVTNASGAYMLDGLQTGTYQVKAELPGFQTAVSTGVQVNAGSPVERDLTMQVGSASQRTEVTSVADAVAFSRPLGLLGGAAEKDTTGLQALPLVPTVSSFADTLSVPGALDRISAETSVVNAVSDKPFLKADQNPISRFSADMNTASYANVRQYLNQNQLPPRDAVRIEAMVNSFSYNYPRPSGNSPLGVSIEVAAPPWNPQHRLVRIGIKAKDAAARRLPAGNTVAKDVKVEVEFNPAVVGEYRLIDDGSPALSTPASNRYSKDAGSVEAGQTLTALYEIVPKASKSGSTRALTVNIHYKDPNGVDARPLAFPLVDRGQTFEHASADFRFAAAVASFGMVLRDSQYKGTASVDSTLAIAEHSIGSDRSGQRLEFVQLVERARQLGVKRQ